jgi:hypothetical protein
LLSIKKKERKNLRGGRRNNVVETKKGVLTNAWGKQKEVKDREGN